MGEVSTCEFKGIPSANENLEKGPQSKNGSGIDNDETEGTTTNKSGLDDDGMALECDGNQCYPKFF